MNKAIVFSFFLFVSLLPSLAAETLIGGQGEINGRIMIQPENFLGSELGWDTVIGPSFNVDSEYFDFFSQIVLAYRNGGDAPTVSIDVLYLVFDPWSFLKIKLGRFNYLPGMAAFLSCTNYFARLDYEKLLSGRIDKTLLPNDMLQVGWFLSDFYLLLTTAPFVGKSSLPKTDSPWFPDKDLPKSITVFFPVAQTIYLENTVLQEPEEYRPDLHRVSVSAELGGSLSFLDFAVMFYHGNDYSLLVKAAFDFSGGLDKYDIILTPVTRIIDVFGLSLAADLGPFTFWEDTSFTLSKMFLTNRLSSDAVETALASAPFLESCVGFTYTPSFLDLTCVLEYKENWILSADQGLLEPAFGSVLMAMVQVDFFENRLSPVVTWIESLNDHSRVIELRLYYRPSLELEVALSAPVFLGEPRSEIGQFRDNHLLSCGVTWRF